MPARRKNWLTDALKTADASRDYVILENPVAAKRLDALLTEEYWPVIQKPLMNSGYVYSPAEPKTEFKRGHELTRAMTFMPFDARSMFFRGVLSCSTDGWMLEREFILSLRREQEPDSVFEILGNSRFRGNPPTLMIDKSSADFYQIKLNAGDGAGWGRYGDDDVKKRITGVIETSVKMYDMARGRLLPADKLGDFLTIAYTAYEAY
jgi:hypothetical protein